MSDRRITFTQALVLALLLSACRGNGRQEEDSWTVGMCALVNEDGTTAVACTAPHTHKVIAIVPRPEECPSTADMFSTPADPDDGLTTTCFRSHSATE